jgi:hypothetical protein
MGGPQQVGQPPVLPPAPVVGGTATAGQTTPTQLSTGHASQYGACHAHLLSVPRVQAAPTMCPFGHDGSA